MGYKCAQSRRRGEKATIRALAPRSGAWSLWRCLFQLKSHSAKDNNRKRTVDNNISFMGANLVAQQLDWSMTEGWNQGDTAANDWYRRARQNPAPVQIGVRQQSPFCGKIAIPNPTGARATG